MTGKKKRGQKNTTHSCIICHFAAAGAHALACSSEQAQCFYIQRGEGGGGGPSRDFFSKLSEAKTSFASARYDFFCPAHIWGNGERGVGGLCEEVQQRNELLSLSSLSIVGSNSGVFERFSSRVYVYVYRFLFLFLFLWHNPQKITLRIFTASHFFPKFVKLSRDHSLRATHIPPPSFSHALPTAEAEAGTRRSNHRMEKKGRGKRE